METLLDRITRHEGKVPWVYDDANGAAIIRGYTVKGNPTIGVGTLISAPGLSDAEIKFLLESRIAQAKLDVAKALPWILGLDEVRQGVIVEMAFQLGITRLLEFKKALAAMRDHNWVTASKEMLNSTWHKQTPLRAEELASIMLKGDT